MIKYEYDCLFKGVKNSVVVRISQHRVEHQSFVKVRYDTRCLFNVRSKANMSQLNLPHGTDKKCKNRKTKSRKQICSEITVNSLGNPCSES